MHEYKVIPRIGETDALGHVNHASVIVWLEASREWFYDIFNPEQDISNWKLVIVRLEVDYIDQLYYGKEVTIKSHLLHIGNASFKVKSEIYQDNRKCIEAVAIYVHFSKELQSSVRISLEQKKQLELYLIQQ